MKNKITIHLASPRGFCAGVDRAIEIVKNSLEKFGAPVYIRHEIVHNKHVVEGLRKKGAIFVEELSEIEDRSRPVIFSAHGVPKSVSEDANIKQIEYIDATCPLVSKVHKEAEQLYKYNYHILLIGHKNHPEVIGTMGQLPKGAIDLIETNEDAKNYVNKKMRKLSYITQTTLSVDDTVEITQILKNKFPDIKEPKKDDICYATTNRQLAVKKIANKCEMFFIIGSRSSSNSKRLVEAAKKSGCSKSYLLSANNAIPIEEISKCKSIGISSGASAPEFLVKEFIDRIKERADIKINEIEVAKENVIFKIPNKLN
jgi:4-hydroxy-3-methylbut-2-enyl diphosphate reductase|tara:strand:+ start:415 stop:1356 length:942 start_codon:yes stop_codon:yes gene_type:complete